MLIDHMGAQVRAGAKGSRKHFRFDAVNQPLQHDARTFLYSHTNQHSVQYSLQPVCPQLQKSSQTYALPSVGKEAETSNCKMGDTQISSR